MMFYKTASPTFLKIASITHPTYSDNTCKEANKDPDHVIFSRQPTAENSL